MAIPFVGWVVRRRRSSSEMRVLPISTSPMPRPTEHDSKYNRLLERPRPSAHSLFPLAMVSRTRPDTAHSPNLSRIFSNELRGDP